MQMNKLFCTFLCGAISLGLSTSGLEAQKHGGSHGHGGGGHGHGHGGGGGGKGHGHGAAVHGHGGRGHGAVAHGHGGGGRGHGAAAHGHGSHGHGAAAHGHGGRGGVYGGGVYVGSDWDDGDLGYDYYLDWDYDYGLLGVGFEEIGLGLGYYNPPPEVQLIQPAPCVPTPPFATPELSAAASEFCWKNMPYSVAAQTQEEAKVWLQTKCAAWPAPLVVPELTNAYTANFCWKHMPLSVANGPKDQIINWLKACNQDVKEKRVDPTRVPGK